MKRFKTAFTLTELLVVIGILAVLVAILLPVFFAVRKKTHTASCTANLRQIGNAMQSYVSDYDGTYPPSVGGVYVNGVNHAKNPPVWRDILTPYVGSHFPVCPSRIVPPSDMPEDPQNLENSHFCGYAYNDRLAGAVALAANQTTFVGTPENKVKIPSLVVAVFDARVNIVSSTGKDVNYDEITKDEITTGDPTLGSIRHQNGANYLFADGHVKWFLPAGVSSDENGDGAHPGFGL